MFFFHLSSIFLWIVFKSRKNHCFRDFFMTILLNASSFFPIFVTFVLQNSNFKILFFFNFHADFVRMPTRVDEGDGDGRRRKRLLVWWALLLVSVRRQQRCAFPAPHPFALRDTAMICACEGRGDGGAEVRVRWVFSFFRTERAVAAGCECVQPGRRAPGQAAVHSQVAVCALHCVPR
jgi:hypothetical protein